MSPGWTKHLYKWTFSKSLTYNQKNLKDLRNRGTLQDIAIKKGIAWNPQPLRHSLQSVFFKSNTLFVLLTLPIKYQGQDNHDIAFENS